MINKDEWKTAKLGDIIELKYGKPLPDFKRKSNGAYPVYGANGVKSRTDEYYHNQGSIIVGRKGSAGEINLTEEKFWPLDVTYFVIFDNKKYNLSFIYHLLSSLELPKLAKGVKPGINRNEVYSIPVKIPSLYEQQRVITIIDKAFATIDKAKVNAEQNLKNVKELFESYLQNVFEDKETRWEKRKLNEITEVKDGTHDSPKYVNEGIPFVTQKNIRQDGLSFANTKFITEVDHEKFHKRSNVIFGDILISMIGANRGMVAIVDDKRIFSIKNVGLIKESKNINMHYLLYYLQSSLAMKYVLFMSNGGAQEFVGLSALRSFPIPYPPLNTQQAIVQKLDALSDKTKKLEIIYKAKINKLEELKKSILQKAFSAELIKEEALI